MLTTGLIAKANRDARPALLWLGIVQFVVLIGFIVTHNHPPLFDEPWYLATVQLLHDKGLTRDFLLALPGPAGPLYTVVHYVFEPLTHLRAPAVRLVNPLLLLISIGFIAAALRLRGAQDHWTSSLAIMGVPMTWVLSGMALTEIPAMLFMCVALLGMMWAFRPDVASAARVVIAGLAGASLGIAVLGRQPYLVLLGGLPFLVKDIRRDAPAAIAFGAGTVLVCAPVFWIWRGMVPPSIAQVGRGIAPTSGMYSMFYAAIIALLIAPRFLRLTRVELILILIVTVLIKATVWRDGMLPMRWIVERVVPASMISYLAAAISGAMLAVGLTLPIAMIHRGIEHRSDRRYLALTVCCLLLLLTPLKITHVFSSRYVAMALPLMILILDRYSAPNYWKLARLAMGSALGLASLHSFFKMYA